MKPLGEKLHKGNVWQVVMNVPEQTSAPDITPSPTPTNTQTPSVTPTNTNTPTPSVTATQTGTPINTSTPTPTITPTATLVTACRRYSLYGGSSGGNVIVGNYSGNATNCGASAQTINVSAFQTILRCGTSAFPLSGTATVTDTGNCS
jgi:hypothetical protein